MRDTERINKYISSSEKNRCNINGCDLFLSKSPKEWIAIFSSSWVNKKLRKKLYTLYQLEILPIKRAVFIGLYDNEPWLKDFKLELAKQYLDAEDRAIL